ncbi:MAG: hypothetical protein C0596_05175 [Marinilabiliales bacterium]|nr:MAG: hypothetical protein C0596_05175 [Marinilabiliales bacterium]
MKKSFVVLFSVVIASILMFSACNSDTQGPKIYFLDADGNVIQSGDTTVLLYTTFVDPYVFVEDNSSKSSNIIVEDNAAEQLSVTSEGYLRRAEEVIITYTATDEAGNSSTKDRIMTIYNISQQFVNSYATTRQTNNLNDDTSYNSSVAADARIPGRLKFPKVYAHFWDGERTYFKVTADLYDPTNLSDEFSETIAYMGTQSDKETPFFAGMSYEEAEDSILSFTYLKIDAQEYTDTAENHTVYIQGVTEEGTDLPLSHIEYLAGSKTIVRIVLELNVTKNSIVDRVTETYVPND